MGNFHYANHRGFEIHGDIKAQAIASVLAPPLPVKWLRTHRVAVLKGGWSRERSISLKTGAAVEQALKRLRIPFLSIDVDKNILRTLQRRKVQFAYIALHGEFGEDGALQCILDFLKIPYTGSGPARERPRDGQESIEKIIRAAPSADSAVGVRRQKDRHPQSRTRDHILSRVRETGGPRFGDRRGLRKKRRRARRRAEGEFQNIRPRARRANDRRPRIDGRNSRRQSVARRRNQTGA